MIRALPIVLLFTACADPAPEQEHTAVSNITHRDDLARLYTDHQLIGSFILHDTERDHWDYIDSAQADVATLPASTFKIFGSLFALETGVVRDAEEVHPWDGQDYGRAAANRDMNLRDAYNVSVYWFFRDAVRKAGAATFKQWLDTVGYGNADTIGGFDQCWLRGNLHITPHQQIQFMEQVQREELPFSPRTYNIVKDIMVRADTLAHTMRAKTGWSMGDGGDIGWYVGWVEAPEGGPYFFANRVSTADTAHATFGEARISITMEVLRELGMWP